MKLRTTRQFFDAEDILTVTNLGDGVVYYGDQTVTSSAYEGTIAVGETETFTQGKWLVAATTAHIEVSRSRTAEVLETDTRLLGRTGNLRAYGDSKCESSESYIGTGRLQDRYTSKLAGLTGAYPRNYGVGGTQMTTEGATQVWPQRNLHTFDGSLPTLSEPQNRQLRAGLHIFDAGFNDGWKKTEGTDGALWATYKHTTRALIHQSRAQFAWAADNSTYLTTTGWTQVALDANYGSKYAKRSTSGSIVWSSASSGGVGGTLVFYFVVYDESPAGRRFRARAKIGSGSYSATLDAASEGLGVNAWQSLVCLPVPDVPAGSTTVTCDIDNITSECRFIGCTLVPGDADEPLVVLVEQPQTPTMPWDGDASLLWTQTAHDACNAALRELADEFTDDRVITVDVDEISSLERYVKDDVHLNNHGETEKLSLIRDAIVSVGGVPGQFSGAYPVVSGTPTFSMDPGQSAVDPSTNLAYRGEGALGRTYQTIGVTDQPACVPASPFPATATSGTDTTPADGTLFLISVFVPCDMTATGIGYLIGSVGGTDKVIARLYSSAGAIVASSTTTAGGTTVGTAANLQEVAFTATADLTGPNLYYIGISMNGNTARLRTLAAHTGGKTFTGSVSLTHAATTAVTVPTAFAADKGPIGAYVY